MGTLYIFVLIVHVQVLYHWYSACTGGLEYKNNVLLHEALRVAVAGCWLRVAGRGQAHVNSVIPEVEKKPKFGDFWLDGFGDFLSNSGRRRMYTISVPESFSRIRGLLDFE